MTIVGRMNRRAALLAASFGLIGPAGALAQQAKPQKFQRLHKALDEMADAKKFLSTAPDVFGGHKDRALAALDVAIREVRESLVYAKDY